jgi:hypothetical protein
VDAHKCALTHGAFKPLSEFNTMLTNMKRMYLPKQHDDLANAIPEHRDIDDVFEVDGVLYDNEDHYTEVQAKIAKDKGEF